MKTRLLSLLSLLVPLAVSAAPGNFSLGFEGTPTSASPAARWALDENTALNLSAPGITYQTSPTGTYWNVGLEIALLPMRRTVGDLKHGPRIGVRGGYSYYEVEIFNEDTEHGVNGGLGFGWDLEYFVTRIPGLSVGANVGLEYAYNWTSETGLPDTYQHQILPRGNILNLRYYF
jgi:hypothetical protein